MKKVAEIKPTSYLDYLKLKIKIVWTREIIPQYCASLIESMPDSFQAKGCQTKY